MELTPDVVPPVKTFFPSPPYTEVARRARIEGLVIVKAIIGLRVDEETEVEGLDISEHGERAYN